MTGINNAKIALLVEGYPRLGFETYRKMLADGTPGLCITRLHPRYLNEKYGISGGSFLWLTGNAADGAVSPKNPKKLLKAVKEMAAKESGLTVFLDGLEYLLLFNDMRKMIALLQEMGDVLAKNGGRMVISIDPLTFEQNDLVRLWEAFPMEQKVVRSEITKVVPQTAPILSSAASRMPVGMMAKEVTATP
jgi:hypothetical protein